MPFWLWQVAAGELYEVQAGAFKINVGIHGDPDAGIRRDGLGQRCIGHYVTALHQDERAADILRRQSLKLYCIFAFELDGDLAIGGIRRDEIQFGDDERWFVLGAGRLAGDGGCAQVKREGNDLFFVTTATKQQGETNGY